MTPSLPPFLEDGSLGVRLARTVKQWLGKTANTQTALQAQQPVCLDEPFFEQLELTLLATDAGLPATDAILAYLKAHVANKTLSQSAWRQALVQAVASSWHAPVAEPDTTGLPALLQAATPQAPLVLVLLGINGSGKTTTLGKLAHWANTQPLSNASVLIGACDTYRAAADTQVGVWAKRAGVPIVSLKPGSDPAAVAVETLKQAAQQQARVVLLDTAGRLHNNPNLLAELAKLLRVTRKFAAEGATLVPLLVLDGGSGQNALQQVEQFHKALDGGLGGLIVTKLEGSAKGGLVLALGHSSPVPVLALGTGEGLEDWHSFDRDTWLSSFVEPICLLK
jgi:fused signal recognition particle receptor